MAAIGDTGGNGTNGTNVNGGICLLADCSDVDAPSVITPSANVPDDGGSSIDNGGDLGTDSMDPAAPNTENDPQGGTGNDDPTTGGMPPQQSGPGLPGLPDTGFAPFTGTGAGGWFYLALAPGAVAAAWFAGMRLVCRG